MHFYPSLMHCLPIVAKTQASVVSQYELQMGTFIKYINLCDILCIRCFPRIAKLITVADAQRPNQRS